MTPDMEEPRREGQLELTFDLRLCNDLGSVPAPSRARVRTRLASLPDHALALRRRPVHTRPSAPRVATWSECLYVTFVRPCRSARACACVEAQRFAAAGLAVGPARRGTLCAHQPWAAAPALPRRSRSCPPAARRWCGLKSRPAAAATPQQRACSKFAGAFPPLVRRRGARGRLHSPDGPPTLPSVRHRTACASTFNPARFVRCGCRR
jgi:hypothetical protein